MVKIEGVTQFDRVVGYPEVIACPKRTPQDSGLENEERESPNRGN